MPRRIPLRLQITFASVLIALVAFAPSVLAGQSLMGELPAGHNTVITIDFTELRDSPLYGEGFEMIQSQPAAAAALRQVQEELGVDVQNDIDALAIASDSPPLSTQMMDDPMDALEDTSQQPSDGALILVRGDVDPDQLLIQMADADEDDGPPTYVRQRGLEVRKLDDRTVAIAGGSDQYLDTARTRLSAERSGPGAAFERGIQRLGASQGVYVLTRPNIADPEAARDEMGALPSFGGLAIGLSDGVQLSGLLTLSGEEEAASMVEEIDAIRNEADGHLAARMFGLQPLVDNLSVRQDEQHLLVRTSMTNDEASRLMSRLQSLLKTQDSLQNPLQGPALDDDDD